MSFDPKDLTYLKLNPRVLLQASNHLLSTSHYLEFYKEDGSPNKFVEMSSDKKAHLMREMLEAAGPMDMRDLYVLVGELLDTLTEVLEVTINQAHTFIHSAPFPDHIDEDKLCEGIKSYLVDFEEESGAPVSNDIHPDLGLDQDEIDERLRGFFTGSQKPN